MSNDGFAVAASSAQYYLHENGSLIYKPHGGVEAEPEGFVRRVWPVRVIGKNPKNFLAFLIDALNSGADRERVVGLARKNDLAEFIGHAPGGDVYTELESYEPGTLHPTFEE